MFRSKSKKRAETSEDIIKKAYEVIALVKETIKRIEDAHPEWK